VIEEVVRVRMERQQLLSSEEGPDFEAVLDESLLHRVVGSPAVMLGQLQRLLAMSEKEHVTIRVVPYGVGTTPAGVNKFRILRFARPDLADVVFIEELTNQRYLEDPKQVEIYNATFRALRNLSEGPGASRSRIRRQIRAFEPQADARAE
jgi:hypothetical protein